MIETGLPPPGERNEPHHSPSRMALGASRKRTPGPAQSDAPRLPWWFSVGFVVAVAAAELATALLDPRWGLVLHAILLVALPLWTGLRWRFPDHKLALAFTLIPLIRVLSLALPLARFPVVTWYALTAFPLIVSAYVVKQMLALSRRDVGFAMGRWYLQLLIALPGVAFGFVEYWILRPQPLISELTFKAAWLPALILLLATGFAEEFVFRGVLQRVSIGVLGARGPALVAVIFAVLHVGYLSVLQLAFVLIVGLYFAWATLRTGSILGVTLAHGVTNIVLFLIIPFLGVMPPGPHQANPQFPLALVRKGSVTTPVAPPRATLTPTPTAHSWPVATAASPLEVIRSTPSGVRHVQETPAHFTWGIPAPQPKAPWPSERVVASPVRLSWEWYRWLLEGEYFEVSLWSDDNLVTAVGTMLVNETHCEFDLRPYPPGTYLWGVRVVEGHIDNGQVIVRGPKTIVGTRRHIRWEPVR